MRKRLVIVLALAVALSVSCPIAYGSSKTSVRQSARAYIGKHGPDANRVRANVLLVYLYVHERKSVDKVALAAQQAHDNLDALRDKFGLSITQKGA